MSEVAPLLRTEGTAGAGPGPVDDPEAPLVDELADLAPTARPSLRRRLGLQFWLCVGWLVVVTSTGLLAPILPMDDPNISDFTALAEPPSGAHWFGTDAVGRDLLARVVWGSRVSLAVGLFSILIGLVIGGTLGLIAGYFRSRAESVVMVMADGMLAFPSLVLLLSLTTFLGQNLRNVIVAIGIVTIPVFIRLARANTLTFTTRDFVLAARATGARDRRVLVREVLPNVALPLMAFSLVVVAVAIVAEGSLSFLGMSVPPTTPTWGNIIAAGRQDLQEAPHIVFVPSVVMFLTVLAFNLAGDRLREVLEVREGAL
jgi:peptide/nickel transport system permease protein